MPADCIRSHDLNRRWLLWRLGRCHGVGVVARIIATAFWVVAGAVAIVFKAVAMVNTLLTASDDFHWDCMFQIRLASCSPLKLALQK